MNGLYKWGIPNPPDRFMNRLPTLSLLPPFAASLFAAAVLVAVLVVVATVAPRCLANWMAKVPTPPEPA